jgi:hypothetical protein
MGLAANVVPVYQSELAPASALPLPLALVFSFFLILSSLSSCVQSGAAW